MAVSRAFIRNHTTARAGFAQVEKKMLETIGLINGITRKELLAVVKEIGKGSQEIVPVGQTGNLKRSMFTDSDIAPSGARAVVGYNKLGSGDADYAVFVHEILSNKHQDGKSAKFLQLPAEALEAEITTFLAGRLKGKIK